MFLCCKDQQQIALEKAIGQANKLLSQEMDMFSTDIQRAMLEKANQKLHKPNFPHSVLGASPYAKLEGSDGYTALLQFQCTNAGKQKAVTCSGRGHSIAGSGQEGDNNRTFEIVQGNWSPAGFCYWVERSTIGNQVKLVMIHWGETSEATVTVIKKNGKMERTLRPMKLFLEKDDTAVLCPSVRTVVGK